MKKFFYLCFLIFCCAIATSQAEDINNKAIDFTAQATQIDLQNAQLSLEQVEQSIKATREVLRNYQEELQALNIGRPDEEQAFKQSILIAKIKNQQTFLSLNEQRKITLQATIKALQSQLINEQQRLQVLSENQKRQARLAYEKEIQNKIKELSQEQGFWLNQINALNQTLSHKAETKNYEVVLQQIFKAEENSNITQFKINLLHTGNSLQNISLTINESASATQLYEERQSLSNIVEQLQQTQLILNKKSTLLQQRADLLSQKNSPNAQTLNNEKQIQDFLTQYQALSAQVNDLLVQAGHLQEKATTLLAKALARRQGLPGFSGQEWLLLGKSLTQTMVMTYQIFIAAYNDVVLGLQQLDTSKLIKLFSLPVLAIAVYFLVRVGCQKIRQKLSTTPENILHRFLDNTLRIFITHLWFIDLLIVSLIFLNILNIANQVSDIVLHIGNTILIYSVALMIARISLYENTTTHSGVDVKLYHRLYIVFLCGFIIAVLMLLSKDLNSTYETQDLFDRLFMIFIFIIAIMLLKAWRVLPEIIINSINPQRNYLIRSIQLLGLLLPLIILSNAVVGLVGFVELAWTISKYEGLFLLVVITYLIIRGLMNDGLNYAASYTIRLRSGWIIVEAFLKPIAIWLHIGLSLVAIYFLLYLYDLNHQAFLINYFYKALHFPLMRFSNASVTVWLFIKALIIASFFIWGTKWSREFAYRKLYRQVRDIGARNSLAIFTQYGVFILGLIFTLKTLQIDLTTLGYIISGFALGIGFGLRDLANNFVSGILILIERPMRRGDTVTIGDYEGKVINIGMRATNLLSSDNREIVVPNSEVFSKIFTNWTHPDAVVRCDTTLKVRWKNDPHHLQEEIEKVMLATKGVLPKPAPEAILKSMTDGLLEFELRFYIDYHINDSRMVMKSKVLFNVWDRFAELGVEPPYPGQRVFLSKQDEE